MRRYAATPGFNFLQVLIATATVAWGVNFPAHLVVVKGTEYYDGKQKRYVDMPITDVLQMIGRAGMAYSLAAAVRIAFFSMEKYNLPIIFLRMHFFLELPKCYHFSEDNFKGEKI